MPRQLRVKLLTAPEGEEGLWQWLHKENVGAEPKSPQRLVAFATDLLIDFSI